jgi:recombination protein RecA
METARNLKQFRFDRLNSLGEYKANTPAMHPSNSLRLQVEAALAHRIPSALTPAKKVIRLVAQTGVAVVDEVLEGGLPVGAITEMIGPECSGRTSLALSFLAHVTQAANVCAWIDVADVFDPESAAAAGVDLSRLLWVRCGVLTSKPQRLAKEDFTLPDKYFIPAPTKKGLHGGGFGPHPRNEVKELSGAVSSFLRPETIALRYAEPLPRSRREPEVFEPNLRPIAQKWRKLATPRKPWPRIEQALQATDLILQGGGFSAVVLDLGSIAPEHASRVQLATWFRYRAAAEKTQASFLLLTQHSCAKSSAELVLRFHPGDPLTSDATIFTGIEHRLEVARRRFMQPPSNVVPFRKPPQNLTMANWFTRSTWAGIR